MAATVSNVRVTVTVEVTTGATYGDEWTLADLRKQVKHEALQMLKNQLQTKLIRVVDDPLVSIVTHTERKD